MLDYMQLAVVFVLGFAFVCKMLNHRKIDLPECETETLTPLPAPWPPQLRKLRKCCVSGNLASATSSKGGAGHEFQDDGFVYYLMKIICDTISNKVI
jgi:hypothetical protein